MSKPSFDKKTLFTTSNSAIFVAYLHPTRDHLNFQQPKNLIEFENQNISPIKLHISLGDDDYNQNKELIIEILIKHLENECCLEFKTLKHEAFKLELQKVEDMHHFIENPTEWLKELGPLDESEFQGARIEVLMKDLQNSMKSILRFKHGDQFTVYFPYSYNLNKIIQLCDEINTFCKEKNLQAGKVLDSAVAITPFINLRQEYLPRHENRVNSVPDLFGNDDAIRFQAKKEVEQSDLCKKLKKHFNAKQPYKSLFPVTKKRKTQDIFQLSLRPAP